MKPLTLADLARRTGAELRGDGSLVVERVVTDSRAVVAGDLFVALPGERVDGHDFVAGAAQAGAVAALVQRALPLDLPQLIHAEPLQALARLAASLRAERATTVLALTGSNGKTSVKTLLHAILARVGRAYANPGNRNNELGMPLALIDQPEDAEYAVYEMGAGQPGDIGYLAEIARPQVALVNNVGPAHLERLGSLFGVAQTKGAIYAHLPVDGVAVINADDAFAPWFSDRIASGQRILRFGLEQPAEVRARNLSMDADGSVFELGIDGGWRALRLALPGRHNVANALAAAAMAHAVGVGLDDVVAGLAAVNPVAGRLQARQLCSGAHLIDDSYNANPASTFAAIAALAQRPAPRWLVLGDMRELGPEADALHAEVGRRAREAGLEHLVAVGEHSAAAVAAFGAGGEHYADQASLIAALAPRVGAGASVLVKGSRGSRMDRVVAALCGTAEDAHAA
jgi:UDP-N-acetylmuramoyl-tripeptide--D-alanyl-D-alanine ligase